MNIGEQTAIRELDHRANDGFDVRLLWDPETDRVFVTVDDQRHRDSFALVVDATDALEAFHHPFAYTGSADTRLRRGASDGFACDAGRYWR